ncbi:MAG: hypothetical protein HY614_02965 [Candidatus Rokubacteria bacterium]|nr:hypothetical protein [Candidatus Rokubacteria bacterium]
MADADKGTQQVVRGSLTAALVIGPFLVLYTLLLGYMALIVWLSEDWASFLAFLGFRDQALTPAFSLPPAKFTTFQTIVVAACSSGLGGIVFMIREFYINFAYGRENKEKNTWEFLRSSEIPRYVLLPFSSVVLGPVGLALLHAGAVIFVGVSRETDLPLYSVVGVSFLLGFGYHDTLGALRRLSRKLFDVEKVPDEKAKTSSQGGKS